MFKMIALIDRYQRQLNKKNSAMPEAKFKIVTNNRKARHDYEIVDNYEAGIVLVGTEVKAIREGRVNLTDAYARFIKNELWLIGAHISPYTKAAMETHDPLRNRKLLLHQSELKKIHRQIQEKGLTVVALKVILKGHLVKIDLGLARGKRKYDKRATIAERDQKRDMERIEKARY